MALNWILFVVFGALAYATLSLMGQLSGGAAHSAVDAGLNLFKNPYALAALVVGNALWAVALYYGLREAKLALPALFAIGVVTGFVYSMLFLGAEVTMWRICGAVLILAGIYLLA
jgi:drug/metabolite transporter (DMT)-like permease